MVAGSFLDSFESDSWRTEVTETITEILARSAEMATYASGIVVYGDADDDPEGAISERYLAVLDRERLLRQGIVARLSDEEKRDEVLPALQLLDLLDTCVRISALSTELYQVTTLLPDEIDDELYRAHLVDRAKALEDMLNVTTMVFSAGDLEYAQDTIEHTAQFISETEQAIVRLTESDLTAADAICLSATLRLYTHIAWTMNHFTTLLFSSVDVRTEDDEPS